MLYQLTSIRCAICHSLRWPLFLVLPIPSLSVNEVISGQEVSLAFITSVRDAPHLKLLCSTSLLRVDLLLKRKFIKVVSTTNSLELNSIWSTATSWVFTGCWDHAVQMGTETNSILTSSQARHVWDAVCLPGTLVKNAISALASGRSLRTGFSTPSSFPTEVLVVRWDVHLGVKSFEGLPLLLGLKPAEFWRPGLYLTI